MTNRFHDLTFSRQPDGSIRLIQQGYHGERYTIDLHPAQLEHLAHVLLGSCEAGRVCELERRISVLVDKLQDIVCDDLFRMELLDRCDNAFEYFAKLDSVLDLALEFDGGRLTPEYKDDPEATEDNKEACATTKDAPAHQKPSMPHVLDVSKPSAQTKRESASSDSQMGLPV